eukprot:scaffold367_cov254-Pinguiococcus_pyrenoidosus.AAC.17
MATGAPPFADEEFNELKARIIGGAIQFPPDAPLPFELQYFISGLLEKEPARRLGCTSADVRMHPFFTGLDWEALEERRVSFEILQTVHSLVATLRCSQWLWHLHDRRSIPTACCTGGELAAKQQHAAGRCP